jgi:hypothetical protein
MHTSDRIALRFDPIRSWSSGRRTPRSTSAQFPRKLARRCLRAQGDWVSVSLLVGVSRPRQPWRVPALCPDDPSALPDRTR